VGRHGTFEGAKDEDVLVAFLFEHVKADPAVAGEFFVEKHDDGFHEGVTGSGSAGEFVKLLNNIGVGCGGHKIGLKVEDIKNFAEARIDGSCIKACLLESAHFRRHEKTSFYCGTGWIAGVRNQRAVDALTPTSNADAGGWAAADVSFAAYLFAGGIVGESNAGTVPTDGSNELAEKPANRWFSVDCHFSRFAGIGLCERAGIRYSGKVCTVGVWRIYVARRGDCALRGKGEACGEN
jgi:hypothetical protein